MVEEDRYCIDVVTQINAAGAACWTRWVLGLLDESRPLPRLMGGHGGPSDLGREQLEELASCWPDGLGASCRPPLQEAVRGAKSCDAGVRGRSATASTSSARTRRRSASSCRRISGPGNLPVVPTAQVTVECLLPILQLLLRRCRPWRSELRGPFSRLRLGL